MSKSVYVTDVSAAGVVTFTQVVDGDRVAEVIEIDVNALDGNIAKRAVAHGVKQKIADAAAMSRDTETGESASPAQKWAKMVRVADALKAGQWELAREGGSGPTGGDLARAISEVRGKPLDKVIAFLSKKTPAEKNALRADKAIKKVLDRMAAERAKASGVDTGALLDGLDEE